MRLSLRLGSTAVACVLLAGPALAQTAAPAAGDPVVATVNGEQIHRSEVEAFQKSLPPQYAQLPLETLFPDLRDQLVDREVVVQAATAQGLDKDPAVALKLAFARKQVLEDAYFDKNQPPITDEEAKARYDEVVKQHPPEDEVHARHILVDSEDQAKKIKAELDKGGDFAALANKYSKDAKDNSGGDLGFFTKDRMVPEFAQAAFAAKPGDIVGPVKTQFGWHLIQVVERRQQPVASFDQVKDQVRQMLAQEQSGKAIDALKAKAKVETFALDGSAPRPEIAPAAPAPAPAP